MRVAIIGFGNQGQKWCEVVGDEVVAVAEPVPCGILRHVRYGYITDIPLDSYDAAIVCTPNDAKPEIVQYLIHNNKHVLVEKPLALPAVRIQALSVEAENRRLVLQTSYNLRFEPHVQRVSNLLQTGTLGEIYHCHMLYGYGTAQDVKDTWRDQGLGIVPEVASHLFDLSILWFGKESLNMEAQISLVGHEVSSSFDRAWLSFGKRLDLEASWVCWANRFEVDIYAEHGSVHINGLLKWGSSSFSHHTRKLPSGRPDKYTSISTEADRSLLPQYLDFKTMAAMAKSGKPVLDDLDRDIAISCLLVEIQDSVETEHELFRTTL